MIKLLKSNSRGDTIVEVLIAMAIVSLVLAGAYVSSSVSSKGIRTAQERGEALKLAESQVEQIKIAVNSGIALPPGSFCFDPPGSVQLPPCPPTGTINYDRSITRSSTSDYVVKVQWAGLSGGTNSVELDYRITP